VNLACYCEEAEAEPCQVGYPCWDDTGYSSNSCGPGEIDFSANTKSVTGIDPVEYLENGQFPGEQPSRISVCGGGVALYPGETCVSMADVDHGMCCGPGEVYSCKGHKCYPASWLGGEDSWCDVNLACYCEEAEAEPCQVGYPCWDDTGYSSGSCGPGEIDFSANEVANPNGLPAAVEYSANGQPYEALPPQVQ